MRRIHRDKRGFTLVELLVVMAILAILAAVAVPMVTGVISGSQTKAAAAEKSNVQTAMDVMMADNSLTTVTAVTTATSDMSAFPTGNVLYPNYMRTATTKGTYTCTTSGVVSQASTGY